MGSQVQHQGPVVFGAPTPNEPPARPGTPRGRAGKPSAGWALKANAITIPRAITRSGRFRKVLPVKNRGSLRNRKPRSTVRPWSLYRPSISPAGRASRSKTSVARRKRPRPRLAGSSFPHPPPPRPAGRPPRRRTSGKGAYPAPSQPPSPPAPPAAGGPLPPRPPPGPGPRSPPGASAASPPRSPPPPPAPGTLGEVAYLGARLLVGLRVQGKFQKELVLLRGQPDPKRGSVAYFVG